MKYLFWASLTSSVLLVDAKNVRSSTPPMGWNSYNAYNCYPSEDIIKKNAQGLVDLGFADLGYTGVTVDCGWPSRDRDAEGHLQWNETLFPSGVEDLSNFIHDLDLKFGLYSGAGYLQCGSTDIPASLGYEELDAESFGKWGGDTLKYDNCYATSNTTMVDSDSGEAKSPARFQKMAAVLDTVNRDIAYYVCQWGIGENVGEWASKIGNSWRMSNDIYNAWRSIWRIVNEAVPYYRHTKAGAFPDLDMLLVGLGALSYEEERFHFGMWAIHKSPLIIGAVLDHAHITDESLEILSNEEVIAINQDSLAKQAELAFRNTEKEWDVWVGELSGSRKVVGISNWSNQSQTVQVNLALAGVSKAEARDPWKHENIGQVFGIETVDLAGHELRLWILSDITAAEPLESVGYYSVVDAELSGSASLVDCGDGECLPTNQKVGNIAPGSNVTFTSVTSDSDGENILGVDFVNRDYSFKDAWEWGTNTRNMTISVNGKTAKRWAFPQSGGDWFESWRLTIEVDGFVKGQENEVVFSVPSDNEWAPDLVGFELLK